MKTLFFVAIFASLGARALSPNSLELLEKASKSNHSFMQMHEDFKIVLGLEDIEDIRTLLAELQRLDPDYATRIMQHEDFWKLSFLLDNGWDPTKTNSDNKDLLTVALQVSHLPNIEVVLKSGGTKILIDKLNKDILKEAGVEGNVFLQNLLAKWEQWALHPKKYPNFLEGQPLTYAMEGSPNTESADMAPSAAELSPQPEPLVLPQFSPLPPLNSGARGFGSGGEKSAKVKLVNDPNMFEVEVPYGTNRAMDTTKKYLIQQPQGAESFYSFTDSGHISYGIAKVSIPKIHKKGNLEERGFFEMKWNPKKHVVLKGLKLIESEEAFFKQVGEMIKAREESFPNETSAKEIFVYIHGFNVDFSYAMRKTAQLMFDMDYPGLSIAYSWPARAVKLPLPQDFRNDVLRAEASISMLETFLNKLRTEHPESKINIIAHSLGTRILSRVLLNIAKSADPSLVAEGAQKLFGQVILAAPAIDATDFINDWSPKITPLCDRISIMASDDDYALKVQSLAEDLKSFPLGLWTDAKAALALNIFNFDISKLSSGTFSLDHSVYSQVPTAIDHMGFLLKKRPNEEELSKLPYAKYMETHDRFDFFSRVKRRVWNFLEQ